MNFVSQFGFMCETSPGDYELFCENPAAASMLYILAFGSLVALLVLGALILSKSYNQKPRKRLLCFHLAALFASLALLVVAQVDLSSQAGSYLSSALEDAANLVNPTHSIFSFFIVLQYAFLALQYFAAKNKDESKLFFWISALVYGLSLCGAAFIA